MFRLGGAAGIIGVALQGAGAFAGGGGGGTQYYQDNRSSYEADMIAFQSAIDNQRLAENVLNGQIQAQNSINDWQFNTQNTQLDAEMNIAQSNIIQQYNSSLFQNSLSRLQNELTNYANTTQYNQAQLNYQYQDAVNQRQLMLDKLGRDSTLDMSTFSNKLAGEKLGIEGVSADAQHTLSQRELGLKENALTDESTKLGYANQGLNLQETQLNQKLSEQGRELDTAGAKNDIQSTMERANIETQRGQQLRELLKEVARSDEEYAVYETLLGAQGRQNGVQSSQIQNDRGLKLSDARGSLMDKYGISIGQAELSRTMGQADVQRGRNDLTSQGRLAKQGINNQRGELDLQRNSIEQQRSSLQNARAGENISYRQGQSMRELQSLGLQAQQGYDVLNQSLIPDVAALGQGLASQWNLVNQQTGLDNQKMMNDVNYNTQNSIGDLQNQSMLDSANNGLEQLLANYGLQSQSAVASYLANKGNILQTQGAGLNQIGANTYGLLSQLGNYRAPAPNGSSGGGGGFNPGALSGVFDGIMGLYANGGGKGQSQGNSGWSNNPYTPEPSSMVTSGNYSGDTINGSFNW